MPPVVFTTSRFAPLQDYALRFDARSDLLFAALARVSGNAPFTFSYWVRFLDDPTLLPPTSYPRAGPGGLPALLHPPGVARRALPVRITTSGIASLISASDQPAVTWWLDPSYQLHARIVDAAENVLDFSPWATRWAFIATVYDPDLMTLTTYVNAGELTVIDHVPGPIALATNRVMFGARELDDAELLHGDLSRVRVFAAALPIQDIFAVMWSDRIGPTANPSTYDPLGQLPMGKLRRTAVQRHARAAALASDLEPLLISSWRMNEGFGGIAFDYASMNGNNAKPDPAPGPDYQMNWRTANPFGARH